MRCSPAFVLLAVSASAYAQQRPASQAPNLTAGPAAPIQAPSATKFTAGCYTNQSGCAGIAHFQAPNNSAISCTVWFGNGAQGQSNFVMPAGQGHDIQVRYGDTYSCVYGSAGVPTGAARSYIRVG